MMENGNCHVNSNPNHNNNYSFSRFRSTAQVTATVQEEDRPTLSALLPHFSLLLSLTPIRTLGESHRMSVSVIRSSASRGRSGSSNGTFYNDGTIVNLTFEVLFAIIVQASSSDILSSVYEQYAIPLYYLGVLEEQSSWLGVAGTTTSSSKNKIPPPAALRGVSEDDPMVRRSLPCQPFLQYTKHLQTLKQLFFARLLIEDAQTVQSWISDQYDEKRVFAIAEEVWGHYYYHLTVSRTQQENLIAEEQNINNNNARPIAFLNPTTNNHNNNNVTYGGVMPPPSLPREHSFNTSAAAFPSSLSPSPQRQTTAAIGMAQLVQQTNNNNKTTNKKRSRKDGILFFVDCLKQHTKINNHNLTTAVLNHYYEQCGGLSRFHCSLVTLMDKLQLEGLLLKRPVGWQVVS
ncbi:hypothetical protein AGDE_16810 [Angomonas deanei]|uniref:Uncharacterized protein n=1 Tax=Angomonas deanei TaxID=59799 RepID=A0A7G2C4X3_9TRYP|nr:hypothetical protein AGDE_16810 [Angomonas deanei]CAD2213783.1 hypothetical protein, conserved [Angomonas deanei]|eukprot:EPY16130.1 hypothetical protein AGDE_16810 [Angomonas deanei]